MSSGHLARYERDEQQDCEDARNCEAKVVHCYLKSECDLAWLQRQDETRRRSQSSDTGFPEQVTIVPFSFENTYSRLPERFYARLPPTPVAAPTLIRVNEKLARQLGLDPEAL